MVGVVVTGWLGDEWTGKAVGRTGEGAVGWTGEVAGRTGDAGAGGGMPDGQTGTIAGVAPAGAAAPAASSLHKAPVMTRHLSTEQTWVLS